MELHNSQPILRATDHQGVRVLHVTRKTAIDAENASDFLSEARRFVRGGERLILDLGNVDFVDSAGLRSLIQLRRDLTRAGGSLALANVRDEVREILEITRLTKIIPLYGDVAAALKEAKREFWEENRDSSCALDIRLEQAGNAQILRVRGCNSIDATNVHELTQVIARCSVHRTPVGVDLRSVEYVDSVALTELARARQRLAQIGTRLFLLVPPALREIILAQDSSWEGDALEREEDVRSALSSNRRASTTDTISKKVEYVDIGLLLERSANRR